MNSFDRPWRIRLYYVKARELKRLAVRSKSCTPVHESRDRAVSSRKKDLELSEGSLGGSLMSHLILHYWYVVSGLVQS